MNKLHEVFEMRNIKPKQIKVVLFGMGGIGKSQLAAKFMKINQKRFTAVFWIDGSTESNLRRSLASCSERLPNANLGLPSSDPTDSDLEVMIEAFVKWLDTPQNSGWLLIFDNIDRKCIPAAGEPGAFDFRKYFPQADQGRILITTRLSRLQHIGRSIRVHTVDNDTARRILNNNTSGTPHNIEGKTKHDIVSARSNLNRCGTSP